MLLLFINDYCNLLFCNNYVKNVTLATYLHLNECLRNQLGTLN